MDDNIERTTFRIEYFDGQRNTTDIKFADLFIIESRVVKFYKDDDLDCFYSLHSVIKVERVN